MSRLNLPNSEQRGFVRGRLNVTNLLSKYEYVTASLDSLDAVVVVYFEAFDCVSHDLFLMKMIRYRFPSGLIKLIKAYLSGRSQFVSVRDLRFDVLLVRPGVRLGSVLGPRLF